ncbi:DUF6571 family protein [Streptomyces sp. NBC_00459]|uniref:DUF6571 family protein n=1 Tax=Streptomyces sp. NBC_00459 TaxID=2975749 RepID=UPI002E17A31A
MRADEGGTSKSVFSGIDPGALKGTIDSVRRDQETLRDRASYYKTQLAYYGVGAEELSEVVRVAGWARDELPMLKRRYHLAMNMDSDAYPGSTGMVQINEAKVTRAANAEAVKDAKRATELAKKNREDLSPAEFDELHALFAENYDEYPFAERVVGALGAKKTLQFWYEMSNVGSSPEYSQASGFKHLDDLDEMQKSFSLTVAQATNSDSPAMEKWKKDMVAIGGDPIRDPNGDAGGREGFVVMSNLMRYGDYDDKFLENYGTALVKADRRITENTGGLHRSGWGTEGTVNYLGSDAGNDPFTGYMKALANSPGAATAFFTAEQKGKDGKPETNFKYLFETREWPDENVTGRNSMGHALEAATTGHRPGEPATIEDIKHSEEQAALFSAIVNSVSQHENLLRDHEYLSDSFANIAAEYMPDLHRSFEFDKANGAQLFPTAGAEANLKTSPVMRFLHTVSRNKEGYDRLNISQHVYAAALMEAQVKHPNAYPLTTDEKIAGIAYDTGFFQGIIGVGQHFQAEKDDVDATARDDAWKEHASTWGGSLVGSATAIATAPFTGPGGVVAGGLVGTAAGEIFNGLLGGFGSDEEDQEKVYQNVMQLDQIQESAIRTTQNSVKVATGDEAAESRAGGQSGRGFADAMTLVGGAKAGQ